jgi:hypothetical protein
MTRRLDKTLGDYVGIAISPVLIITLVGSLLFFLVEVFYQGQYSGRLHLVLGCFTVAAVLIGRIAIEEGRERAQMFAALLAVVTYPALMKFVQFHGGLLGNASWAANLFLLGLVWWSAHKLTWDCTLIDETQDASGEGLMQTIGLDERAAQVGPAEPEEPEAPEGVTSGDAKPAIWWDRFVERQRRPHAPGVWVVYFSLAALPLFGIGQLFIPRDDVGSRRYAFLLLLVYVASGMGLLLSTSFLGLRRYLRQRRIQMPPAMAGLWVAIGCALIVGLLLFTLLLPRPGAELDIANLPFRVDSAVQQSSRYAMMQGEPAEEDKGGPRSGTEEDDQQAPPGASGEGKQPGSSGESDSEQEEAGSGKEGDQGESTQASQGGEQGSSSSDSQGEEGGSSSDSQAEQEGSSSSSQEGDRPGEDATGDAERERGESESPSQSEPSQQDERGGRRRSESEQAKAEKQDRRSRSEKADERRESRSRWSREGGRRDDQRRSDEPSEPSSETADDRATADPPDEGPSFDPEALMRGAGSWLGTLLKWIFYGLLLLAIVYWLWRSRAELLRAFRDFLQGWREFWQRLFGRKTAAAEGPAGAETGPERAPARPFSDFPDPFATGAADRLSPNELVRYSFEALEAWAREHGWARGPEQTPHEFAHDVGTRVHALAQDVRRLADLYCRVAYTEETLSRKRVAPLKHLWQELRYREPVSV